MSKPGWGLWHGWMGGVGLLCAACGGGGAGAKAPGTCPEGTVLQGQDCIPADSADTKASAKADKSAPSSVDPDERPAPAPEPSQPAAQPVSEGGKTPYMKDAVEVELKRGARQVKANCGSATDDEGHALGPWGKTKASITLGRNGHVRAVSLPEPYAGKPVAVCVAHAFDKIQFPPYAGDSDSIVEWDIELVRPKH